MADLLTRLIQAGTPADLIAEVAMLIAHGKAPRPRHKPEQLTMDAIAPTLKPEHVVEEWNDRAARIGKPLVRDLTDARRVLIKARIAQNTLDDFIAVFDKIERSQFLRDGAWCCFDWVFKSANFQKIKEGNYNDEPAQVRPRLRAVV